MRSVRSRQSWRQWRTRSRRIRTFAKIPFEVALLVTAEPPKYQQIAEKAFHLNQLRFSHEAIARHIGVDGKTVAKALSWALDRS
jgi:hypothetical protein